MTNIVNVMIISYNNTSEEYLFIDTSSSNTQYIQRAIEYYIKNKLGGFNSAIFPVTSDLWKDMVKKAVTSVADITVQHKIELLNSICRDPARKISKILINYDLCYPVLEQVITADGFKCTQDTTYGLKVTSYIGNAKNIVIPDKVGYIGGDAFLSNTKLSEVTIGSGTTRIGVNAFDCCSNLKKLYYNAKTCTLDVATKSDGTSYDVRSPFTGCGDAAEGFDIIVGAEVTKLPAGIFKPWTQGRDDVYVNIKSITILSANTAIDVDAFTGHNKAFTINYAGTQAQWESEAIGGATALAQLAKGITCEVTYSYTPAAT